MINKFVILGFYESEFIMKTDSKLIILMAHSYSHND